MGGGEEKIPGGCPETTEHALVTLGEDIWLVSATLL